MARATSLAEYGAYSLEGLEKHLVALDLFEKTFDERLKRAQNVVNDAVAARDALISKFQSLPEERAKYIGIIAEIKSRGLRRDESQDKAEERKQKRLEKLKSQLKALEREIAREQG